MRKPRIKFGRVKFDPLKNVRTSQVFFELVSGPKTPNDLAEALKVTPGAVIHQLRRLQEIGIVRRGRKSGKFQNYEINWRIFVEDFFSRATRRISVASEILARQALLRPINKYFQVLIKEYFMSLVEDIKRFGYRDLGNRDLTERAKFLTVSDAIEGFNSGLMRVFPGLKKKEKTEDEEKQKFLVAMEEWFSGLPLTAPQFAVRDAFKRMNLLTNS